MNELCTKRKDTCWVNKPPVLEHGRRCHLLSQEGHPLLQGCHQKVSYVCKKCPKPNPKPEPKPVCKDFYKGKDGYCYKVFNAISKGQKTYDGAVKYCKDEMHGELSPLYGGKCASWLARRCANGVS